jgi:chromosome segregation ATPase
MSSWRGWNWDDGNFGGSGLEPQEAQEIVTHAEREGARIEAQTTTARNELKTTLQSLHQVKKDLGKTQAALDEARDELEKTKSARDLLSGF